VPKRGRDYTVVIARGSHLQRTRGGPKRESVIERYDDKDDDEDEEDEEAEEAEEAGAEAGAGVQAAEAC
jgi:hypothetical protein